MLPYTTQAPEGFNVYLWRAVEQLVLPRHGVLAEHQKSDPQAHPSVAWPSQGCLERAGRHRFLRQAQAAPACPGPSKDLGWAPWMPALICLHSMPDLTSDHCQH